MKLINGPGINLGGRVLLDLSKPAAIGKCKSKYLLTVDGDKAKKAKVLPNINGKDAIYALDADDAMMEAPVNAVTVAEEGSIIGPIIVNDK